MENAEIENSVIITQEEYEKYNYEHVYAITVLFSQKTVNELTNQFDYEDK